MVSAMQCVLQGWLGCVCYPLPPGWEQGPGQAPGAGGARDPPAAQPATPARGWQHPAFAAGDGCLQPWILCVMTVSQVRPRQQAC